MFQFVSTTIPYGQTNWWDKIAIKIDNKKDKLIIPEWMAYRYALLKRQQRQQKQESQIDTTTTDSAPSTLTINNECSICSNSMSTRYALSCGHTDYCIKCIETLKKESQKIYFNCPTCRAKIKKYTQIYLSN